MVAELPDYQKAMGMGGCHQEVVNVVSEMHAQ
jgi:hypothetical protein